MIHASGFSLLRGLAIAFCLSLPLTVAANSKPLLMEGKKTLYQRVLSVPDARLYQTPTEGADSSAILPFSVLYVYEKGSDWIRVGYDSFGQTAGWVRRDQAIDIDHCRHE